MVADWIFLSLVSRILILIRFYPLDSEFPPIILRSLRKLFVQFLQDSCTAFACFERISAYLLA